jgi:hypothetical protein
MPSSILQGPACGSGVLVIKCSQQVGSKDFFLYRQENNGSSRGRI